MTSAHGILLATLIAIMGAAMSLVAGANAGDAILSGRSPRRPARNSAALPYPRSPWAEP